MALSYRINTTWHLVHFTGVASAVEVPACLIGASHDPAFHSGLDVLMELGPAEGWRSGHEVLVAADGVAPALQSYGGRFAIVIEGRANSPLPRFFAACLQHNGFNARTFDRTGAALAWLGHA